MAKVIGIRLVRLIATLIAVSILTFLMTSLLPGDPVNSILPPDAPRDPETIAQIRQELGLDDPLPLRYVNWLGDAISGDLGRSYITDQPVAETIKQRIPVTAELALVAIAIALILAVPIGVLGAYRQGRASDQISSAGVQVALSVPNFIGGIFLIWLFAVKLGWFPATGWARLTEKGPWENFKGVILPATALAMTQMAIFSRILRTDMIATLQENYVLSARAKGLKDSYILFRHALRPSSLSLVTIAGINIGALLGGTVVIETLFAIGGLGFRLINAINARDILVVQGITVFIATVYVVINTAVDLLYIVIDPRIRRG
jgi:peptide/nickel transport system permease protein